LHLPISVPPHIGQGKKEIPVPISLIPHELQILSLSIFSPLAGYIFMIYKCTVPAGRPLANHSYGQYIP